MKPGAFKRYGSSALHLYNPTRPVLHHVVAPDHHGLEPDVLAAERDERVDQHILRRRVSA
jgi:hypothetical protein